MVHFINTTFLKTVWASVILFHISILLFISKSHTHKSLQDYVFLAWTERGCFCRLTPLRLLEPFFSSWGHLSDMPLNISEVSAKGLISIPLRWSLLWHYCLFFWALLLYRGCEWEQSYCRIQQVLGPMFFPLNFAGKGFTTFFIIYILLCTALRNHLALLTFCLEITLAKSTSSLDLRILFHITVGKNIFKVYHNITRVSFHSTSNKIHPWPSSFQNSLIEELLASACHPSQTKYHTF